MGTCPGGVANQAIAAARLGLRPASPRRFGDRRVRGLQLATWKNQDTWTSPCPGGSGWRFPVTVSLCVDQDRSMVSRTPLAHERF